MDKKPTISLFWRCFTVTSSVAVVVVAGIIYGLLYFDYLQDLSILKLEQWEKVTVQHSIFDEQIDVIAEDILIMANNHVLREKLLDNRVDSARYYLALNYLEMIDIRRRYDQARYIDVVGNEVVRVNFNDGNPEIVDISQLQNKEQRDYFSQTIKLPQGDIFFSPFDLNIEHGRIEFPLKPVIRLSSPLYSSQGEQQGIVVLNYLGHILIDRLNAVGQKFRGESYCVNNEGRFVMIPDSTQSWDYLLDTTALIFSELFPEGSRFVEANMEGQRITDQGLFTFQRVVFEVEREDAIHPKGLTWVIISFVPKAVWEFGTGFNSTLIRALLLLIILVVLLVSWIYAQAFYRKRVAQYELLVSEQKLKVANATKDRFFSILAHDLRNHVGAIMGFLELVVNEYDLFTDDVRKSNLKLVFNSSEQMYNLLMEILEWANAQQGSLPCDPEILFIKGDILSVVDEQAIRADTKGVSTRIDVPDEISLFADKKMVRTILRNLLTNAIKFSKRGGEVVISAQQSTEFIAITIQDFGVGIAPKNISRLFDISEKFQTPGTENETGTGVGLKLVYELVVTNGGTIEVYSELGQGSSFVLKLPRSADSK